MMFSLSKLLQIIFEHSKRRDWSNPKKLTEGITLILEPNSFVHINETFYNKLFNGVNKGRTLYKDILDTIDDSAFSDYVFEVEKRLLDRNYNDRNFDTSKVVDEFYRLIEIGDLPREIQLGLISSYKQNSVKRPYLFIVECLFYALELEHNKKSSYRELNFESTKHLANSSIDKETLVSGGYSSRTLHVLNLLSNEELDIFRKIAPLTFYDCAEDELSGEIVEDRYLISHEDFYELFEVYGVKAVEISKMLECGLLSSGGTHELIVSKEYDCGFQNDNLVLLLSTESDETFTVSYNAFHVTQAGKDLIEILDIETDDEFFRHLSGKLEEGIDIPVLQKIFKIEKEVYYE